MSKFTLCPQCSAELKEDFEVCWKCNFEPSNKEQAIATNLSDLESNSCDWPAFTADKLWRNIDVGDIYSVRNYSKCKLQNPSL